MNKAYKILFGILSYFISFLFLVVVVSLTEKFGLLNRVIFLSTMLIISGFVVIKIKSKSLGIGILFGSISFLIAAIYIIYFAKSSI
jgi:hypothetical protein